MKSIKRIRDVKQFLSEQEAVNGLIPFNEHQLGQIEYCPHYDLPRLDEISDYDTVHVRNLGNNKYIIFNTDKNTGNVYETKYIKDVLMKSGLHEDSNTYR